MRYVQICFGNILITFAYAFLCVPNDILNGGVTCMAMIIAKFLQQDVAVCSAVLICILLLFCFFCLGNSYFRGSLFSGMCYTALFAIFRMLPLHMQLPIPVTLTAAALLVGLGYGICIRANATTLGFDTVALYLHKSRPTHSISSIIFCINAVVMLFGSISFGLSALIKGILFIRMQTLVLDLTLHKKQREELPYDAEA